MLLSCGACCGGGESAHAAGGGCRVICCNLAGLRGVLSMLPWCCLRTWWVSHACCSLLCDGMAAGAVVGVGAWRHPIWRHALWRHVMWGQTWAAWLPLPRPVTRTHAGLGEVAAVATSQFCPRDILEMLAAVAGHWGYVCTWCNGQDAVLDGGTADKLIWWTSLKRH